MASKKTKNSSVVQSSSEKLQEILHQKLDVTIPLLRWQFLATEKTPSPILIRKINCSPTLPGLNFRFSFYVQEIMFCNREKKKVKISHRAKSNKYLVIDIFLKQAVGMRTACKGTVTLSLSSTTTEMASHSFSGCYSKETSFVSIFNIPEETLLISQAKDEQEDEFILSCDIEVAENGIQVTQDIQETDSGAIQEDFSNLWEKIEGRDLVAFIVGRKRVVHAHRSVLEARSPYFKAKYLNDEGDDYEDSIQVDEKYDDILEHVLQFIYTDKVTPDAFNEVSAWKFLDASSHYGLTKLQNQSEEFLLKRLTIQNANEFLDRSSVHTSSRVRERALNLIHQAAHEIIAAENWNSTVCLRKAPLFLRLITEFHAGMAEQKIGENTGAENIEQHELDEED